MTEINDERDNRDLTGFQEKIGYKFKNMDLLKKALTHRSYFTNSESTKEKRHNERLEFLGDSVLGLVISDYLFHRYPRLREGPMTKIKSFIVSRKQLAKTGRNLGMHDFMFLSDDERLRTKKYNTVVSDSVEALIGAVYLDSGIKNTKSFILQHFKDTLDELNPNNLILDDYKSILQQIIQKEKQTLPKYETIKEKGPEHNKIFVVQLSIDDDVISRASGSSKKQAEQRAAQKAYKILHRRWKTFRFMKSYINRLKKTNK